MRYLFGWGLPPGVSNRMIEEQAGAFEEEEPMEKLMHEIETILYDDVVSRPITKVRKAITRIGKAYADGELELLGEEKRIYLEQSVEIIGHSIPDNEYGTFLIRERRIVIALRKEEP